MKENPAFTRLLQMTVEVFLVLLVATLWIAFAVDTPGNPNEADTAPPLPESSSSRPGGGGRLATIEITAGEATLLFRSQQQSFHTARFGAEEMRPDRIVLKLRGAGWREFFNYVLQQDLPVTVEAGP